MCHWCIPLLEWAEVHEGRQVERIKDLQSDEKANLCLWECGGKEKVGQKAELGPRHTHGDR